MYYTPYIDMALNSVEHIMRDVKGGWLLCYMYANGANMFLKFPFPQYCSNVS